MTNKLPTSELQQQKGISSIVSVIYTCLLVYLIHKTFDTQLISQTGFFAFIVSLKKIFIDVAISTIIPSIALGYGNMYLKTKIADSPSALQRLVIHGSYFLFTSIAFSLLALIPIAFWSTYKTAVIDPPSLIWTGLFAAMLMMEISIKSSATVMNHIYAMSFSSAQWMSLPLTRPKKEVAVYKEQPIDKEKDLP